MIPKVHITHHLSLYRAKIYHIHHVTDNRYKWCFVNGIYNIYTMKRLSILKQPALSVINDHLIDYPTPSNINYMWSFGSLAGLSLIVQIATGIFLAMHYTPHVDLAFLSVEHIMRDVEGGWLLRYMHANGASMFFIVVYMHIFRNLYYASYSSPRELVWCVGVVILLLMILTAFIGYVLPWGFIWP